MLGADPQSQAQELTDIPIAYESCISEERSWLPVDAFTENTGHSRYFTTFLPSIFVPSLGVLWCTIFIDIYCGN